MEPAKSVDPVEERDIQKLLVMIREPRVMKALLDAVETEYEERLNKKGEL